MSEPTDTRNLWIYDTPPIDMGPGAGRIRRRASPRLRAPAVRTATRAGSSTIEPDGRPHVVGVGTHEVGGAWYFTSEPGRPEGEEPRPRPPLLDQRRPRRLRPRGRGLGRAGDRRRRARAHRRRRSRPRLAGRGPRGRRLLGARSTRRAQVRRRGTSSRLEPTSGLRDLRRRGRRHPLDVLTRSVGRGRRERDAYLARLGLEAEPPSVDALFRLHRAHVERVPYETLWIHLGDRWASTPTASATRVATTTPRRLLLPPQRRAAASCSASLGYDVSATSVACTVRCGPAEDDARPTTSCSPCTACRPTTNPDGDLVRRRRPRRRAARAAAARRRRPSDQGPFLMSLEATPGGVGDWHLTHDPTGGFAGMSWRSAPTEMDDVRRAERVAVDRARVRLRALPHRADRATPTGVDVAARPHAAPHRRGRERADAHDEGRAARRARRPLRRSTSPRSIPTAFDRMWERVHAAHLAWEAAGRP